MKTLLPTNGKEKFRVALIGLLFLLMTLSLGACGVLEGDLEFEKVDNVQIGMVESSGLNNTEARFHTLTGRKSWREHLQENDTFSLEYEAELEKGTLLLQVENPSGV